MWVRTLSDGRETRVASESSGIGGISWSPDGAHLVFTVGAGAIRHEQTPDYSGSKIIYTITENVPGRTHVVASTGGDPTELTAASGAGFGGRRWLDPRHFLVDRTSPDFKRRTTTLIDIMGGPARTINEDVEERFWSITGDAGASAQPSPDGKWIAFVERRDGWDHVMSCLRGGPAIQIEGEVRSVAATMVPDGTRWRSTRTPRITRQPAALRGGDQRRSRTHDHHAGHQRSRHEHRAGLVAGRHAPVYQHTDPESADLYVVNAKSARPGSTDRLHAGVDRSVGVRRARNGALRRS
jgi:hypothetical protein